MDADHRRTGSGADEPDPRRWLALAVLLLAGFMNLIDVTIVNVAIPSLQRDLGASSAEIEWVVAAYVLAFALGLLPFGRLGDIVGRKRMFLIGITGFTIGSACCGLSPTIGALVASRVLQGLAGAMMMPQVLAIVQTTFPPAERGFAFSLFGVTAGLASVLGPIVGGTLIAADFYGLDWRPIFLVNIPIGVFAVLAGKALIPTPRLRVGARIDFVGVVLGALTVFCLIFPLIEGRESHWPAWCFVLFAASACLAVLFVLWERHRRQRGESELLPLSLLVNRTYLLGLAMTTALFSGIPGFFLVMAVFLQTGFGLSPLQSGLTTVPFSAGVFISSLISGRFGNRLAKPRLIVGPLVMAFGMMAVRHVVTGISGPIDHWDFLLPLLVAGLGFGTTIAPLFATILTAVEPKDAGSGSGALQSFQQIGGAFGVAIVGEIFFGVLASRGGGTPAAPAFQASLQIALLYEIGIFVVLAGLSSLLPKPRSAANGLPADVRPTPTEA